MDIKKLQDLFDNNPKLAEEFSEKIKKIQDGFNVVECEAGHFFNKLKELVDSGIEIKKKDSPFTLKCGFVVEDNWYQLSVRLYKKAISEGYDIDLYKNLQKEAEIKETL